MKYKFFRDYHKFVNILWLIIGALYLVRNLDYFPFFAALIFTIAIVLPFYGLTNFMVNVLQPKALNRKTMGIFGIQFIAISFLTTFIGVLTSYSFYYLSEIGYFPRSIRFTEMSPILTEAFDVLPIVLLLNFAFSGIRLYLEHTKLQQAHLETQLKMLQSQINPHFMFNVLNHIYILIRKDPKLAAELLEGYSEILRYQLYNGKKESVTLREEIQFINDVIKVETIRWKDSVLITSLFEVQDEWKNLPPQIFAVFVENAFKYVSRSSSNRGYVNIRLTQKDNKLLFIIENSKSIYTELPKSKPNSSGIGIANAKDRLKISYPNRHKLCIKDEDNLYRVELEIILN